MAGLFRRCGALLPLLLLLALALAVACDDDGEAGGPAPDAGTATAAGAASPAPTAPAPVPTPSFPLTLKDESGAEVVLEAAPQRIVSYSPGATEILFAIGAGDRVVAADRFSDYPPEAAALPKLEYSNPDPEAALAHDPDLVIFASRQRDQLQQFRDLGLTVLFLPEAEAIDGIYETVLLLGALTGNEDGAVEVVAEMRARIGTITNTLADVEQGPRVFFELSPDLYTVAPDTFIGGMLAALKARNIAEGAQSSFPQLSAEAVIEADPEVIILADAEEAGETAESVAARPGWTKMAAVTAGRIHPIDPDIVNRPGPRIAEGIEALARAIYPARFP